MAESGFVASQFINNAPFALGTYPKALTPYLQGARYVLAQNADAKDKVLDLGGAVGEVVIETEDDTGELVYKPVKFGKEPIITSKLGRPLGSWAFRGFLLAASGRSIPRHGLTIPLPANEPRQFPVQRLCAMIHRLIADSDNSDTISESSANTQPDTVPEIKQVNNAGLAILDIPGVSGYVPKHERTTGIGHLFKQINGIDGSQEPPLEVLLDSTLGIIGRRTTPTYNTGSELSEIPSSIPVPYAQVPGQSSTTGKP